MVHYLPNVKHLNICVLGEVGIGKSSLIIQFVQSHFTDDYDPTLQDTYSRSIHLKKNSDSSKDDLSESAAVRSIASSENDRNGENTYVLDILDTVGIEDYSELRENQIKEADAIVFCYDVTSKLTYDIVTLLHQQVLRCREDDLPPMVLCGTRSDLVGDRQLSYQDGEILAKELNLKFFLETSAKLNVNVEKCFTKTAEAIVQLQKSGENNSPVGEAVDKDRSEDDEVDAATSIRDYQSNDNVVVSDMKNIKSSEQQHDQFSSSQHQQSQRSRTNSSLRQKTKDINSNNNNNKNSSKSPVQATSSAKTLQSNGRMGAANENTQQNSRNIAPVATTQKSRGVAKNGDSKGGGSTSNSSDSHCCIIM